MTYWPFWLSGVALAAIPIVHWLVVKRMLAVSGRFTRLVDRLRDGPSEPDVGDEMSEEEMIAAIQAMAVAEFGEDAVEEVSKTAEEAPVAPDDASSFGAKAPPQPLWVHAGFLAALILGGALSALLAGTFEVGFGLGSAAFEATFGDSPVSQSAALLFGGMLVGWGTRMAGGCTSGHGLCGVSRAQSGSILATAAFFGTGIVVAIAMDALL